MVPSIGKSWSGTQGSGLTSTQWAWPNPPGAGVYDKKQGGYTKLK
jgi:hypothetical protein